MRKWAYEVKGIAEDKAEIIVCAEQLPRPHHDYRLLLDRCRTTATASAPSRPASGSSLTATRGARERDHAEHGRFLVEPIQGEAGVVVPPDGYLRGLRELCDKHRILWSLDEIQTGFGRTGKMFACEHEGIEPDLMIWARRWAAGATRSPRSSARREVLDVFKPGDHG